MIDDEAIKEELTATNAMAPETTEYHAFERPWNIETGKE